MTLKGLDKNMVTKILSIFLLMFPKDLIIPLIQNALITMIWNANCKLSIFVERPKYHKQYVKATN